MDATLRQLTAYVTVARAASFTAAAAALHQSQSSLSRAVADLERQFGAQLLHRDTRNVHLTPAGVEALRVAEQILTTHRAGMREMHRYLNGESGLVTVATLPSVAARVLPAIIAAFREQWPDVSVHILDGLERAVADRVLSSEADFAISTLGGVDRRLDHHSLVKDRFHAVLPEGHPLTRRAEVSWADLAAERFLAVGPDSSVRRLTDAAFREAGLSVVPAAEAVSIATIGGLIAAGLGVSALPALVLPLTVADVVARPLVGPVVDRRLDIVRRAHRPLPVPAARFLELLEDARRVRRLPEGVSWA